ncbi:MAG: hypothetical protein HQL70_05875 [Magnetococcales bacterium]|nr:hypothetical protein [Magnetococcales bacterium]
MPDKSLEEPQKKGAKKWLPVWMTLGSRSYWRSFVCGRFGCSGGSRDFAWLSLLLALVLSMALLLVGTRAGLLERFTDALLGTLRPHGVPVWAKAHWQNHDGIQTTLLDQLKELEKHLPGESFGLKIHPYRRLATRTPSITMPGTDIWNSGVPMLGWAVYPQDPLWQLGAEPEPEANPDHMPGQQRWIGLPMSVVLSESLFTTQFNYEAYRARIQPILKAKKLRRLPAKLPNGSIRSALDTIWLQVQIGDREELLQFKTRWVHHIPAMEKVAYLFPLSTYNALLASYHFPEIRYDPNSLGRGDGDGAKNLTSNAYPANLISTYAYCIQNEINKTGLTTLPNVKDESCHKPVLPFGLGELSGKADPGAWDTLNHDDQNRLWLPCHRLPRDNAMRRSLCPRWQKNSAGATIYVPWDVTGYGTAFEAIHAYVPDPTKLTKGINALLALKVDESAQALNIHPMYQDALNRFNLLSDLLSTMVPAYALTFGIFLGALLLAQIGALIGHRRHHYGILLSRGVTWLGIYAKLFWQMVLATLTAGTFAVFVVIPGLRYLLEDGFDDIILEYQGLLPPDYNFEVLPLMWQSVLFTIAEVFVVIIFVTIILLFRLPLRGNTAPSDLLHGDGRAPNNERRKGP